MANPILSSLIVVFSGAFASLLVCRFFPKISSWLLSVFPIFAFITLLRLAPNVFEGEAFIEHYEWVNELRFNFRFDLDGLSLLFSLLITGIGTLIVIYGGSYLAKDKHLPRFYFSLFVFMGAMLGMTLSDNIFVLFIFWELTSISSYLLIGYHHEQEPVRRFALQALLVTGMGGLAMIAGMILAANTMGTPNISEWASHDISMTDSPHFHFMLPLLLMGAFTKSAQFPFHFWLPNAMAAPTPVSAYLHSATMVKAGVYLLARLNPHFSHTTEWQYALIFFGAITMLVGAFRAVLAADLKKILAYTTISSLGIMTLAIGIGTAQAIQGMTVFLLAHAFYKGSLFMIAGNIDHETGTRNLPDLSGLWRSMPASAVAATVASLSMAGFPFFPGFLSKEILYAAVVEHPGLSALLTPILLLTNGIFVALAFLLSWKIFFARPLPADKISESPVGMWLGSLVLGIMGLLLMFLPFLGAEPLIAFAAAVVLPQATGWKLELWHGFTPALALSAITFLAGWIFYKLHQRYFDRASAFAETKKILGMEALYNASLNMLLRFAGWLTSVMQNGHLRVYIAAILGYLVLLLVASIVHYRLFNFNFSTTGLEAYEILLALLIVSAVVFLATSKLRRIAVVIVGVVGYGVAIFYAIYGGIDLAMTQFLIETLTVVVFVYILSRLPKFIRFSKGWQRWRDVFIAATGGIAITAVVLLTTNFPPTSEPKLFYAENSVPLGKGRNVVNVILVDFRAFDTFGEITVLSVAALGVFTLIMLSVKKSTHPDSVNSNSQHFQKSFILDVSVKVLFPLLLAASLLSLFRGHNEPGGGFIGGLLASSAVVLMTFARGLKETKRVVRADPVIFILAGLLFAFTAFLFPVLLGYGFSQALWLDFDLPFIGKPGTPMLFDIGVYLCVIGAVCKIIFVIGE